MIATMPNANLDVSCPPIRIGAVALREVGVGEIVHPGWSDRQGELVKGSQEP
jgi:hypothetical protein